MKTYKKILCLLLATASIIGCEKNFDPQIYGTFNTTTTPGNVSDVENIVATCYLPFASFWNYTFSQKEICWNNPVNGVLFMFDNTSDLMAPIKVSASNAHNRFSYANFNDALLFTRSSPGDNNVNHMHGVTDVSSITKYIDVIEKCTCLTDDQKKKYIGEMRLCRGLSMYLTLNSYGPLPFIREAKDLQNEEVLFKLERPSLDQVCEWITEDFEFAIENMWKPGERNQNGRYHSDYAKVCLARHCLNEGYHIQGYYAKAETLLKEIINSKSYALFDKTTKVNPYVDLFLSANGFNSEIIAGIDVAPVGGNAVNGNYNAIAIYCLTSWAALDETHNPHFGILGSGWGQSYNVCPKFFHTFEKGDLRKETIDTTYIANSKYKYQLITEKHMGSWWDGFIVNKYRPEKKGTYQDTDIPLARYSDVLLLCAEAIVRNGGAVTSDAINYVNDVRKRAGLENLKADQTSSKEAFLDAILLERGHELFFEGFRKIDLIRFNKYATNCAIYKGQLPTHQYMPLPNYAVNQATEHGCTLTQTFEREGWAADYANAQSILK